MRAAPAVKKGKVKVDRLAIARQPRHEPLLHRVEVQRLVPIATTHADDPIAGLRRHPELRLDTGGHHAGAACDLQRQDALLDEEHVALEPAALVLRTDDVDDPGDADALGARHRRAHEHHIVKLKVLVRLDRHPPLERRRDLRPQHHPDTTALARLGSVLRHTPPRARTRRRA